MTEKTEKELRELIENPPAGNAIAKAKEFGVDLHSILENLKLTPAEPPPPCCRGNRFCSPPPPEPERSEFVSGIEQLLSD